LVETEGFRMDKDLEKVKRDLEEAIVRLRLALRSLLRETLLLCRDVYRDLCLGLPLFCRDVYRLAICRRRRLTGGKAHGE
jgi:hypothetical protein